MSTSQFIIKKSTDSGAPQLQGQSGSLIAVLDYCLTGSTTGWTRTFTSSSGATIVRAVYQMPSGSGFSLNIQDDCISTSKEARLFGLEVATSQDTGSGQFPTLGQGVSTTTYGYVVVRKSTSIDTTNRSWQCFVDSSTFYFFVLSGDVVGTYEGWSFGDLFSLKSPDPYRCYIMARQIENNGATSNDSLDALSAINSATNGQFIARTYGGGGISTTIGKHGDATKGSATALLGTTQYPNGTDGTIYMSPVWVTENASSTIRGRMRGFYQMCHAIANFTDGDTFNGSATFGGKTFQIIKQSGNSGVYTIETSATVETN